MLWRTRIVIYSKVSTRNERKNADSAITKKYWPKNEKTSGGRRWSSFNLAIDPVWKESGYTDTKHHTQVLVAQIIAYIFKINNCQSETDKC